MGDIALCLVLMVAVHAERVLISSYAQVIERHSQPSHEIRTSTVIARTKRVGLLEIAHTGLGSQTWKIWTAKIPVESQIERFCEECTRQEHCVIDAKQRKRIVH
jgi:hypothetical protein